MSARGAALCWAGIAILATMGCVVVAEQSTGGGSGGSGGTGGRPVGVGPVARTATEAWPEQPRDVPVLDRVQIAQACGRSVACASTAGDPMRLLAVDICVHQVEWSAERAIPLSGLTDADERAERWVDCVLAAADCDAVASCRTGRSASIHCEEAGCRNTARSVTVTCDGNVATIVADGQASTRDCARAYATCDTASSTGCTDRHFTSCPSDLPPSDRCDGDIRLGCDGAGQVSYHDCSRMGGRCGTVSGSADCIYTDSPDPACTAEQPAAATCNGTTLELCVNDEVVSLADSELCP